MRIASRTAIASIVVSLAGLAAFTVWLLGEGEDPAAAARTEHDGADRAAAPAAPAPAAGPAAAEAAAAAEAELAVEREDLAAPAGRKDKYLGEEAYLARNAVLFKASDVYNPRHPVLTVAQAAAFELLLDELARELETLKKERDPLRAALFRRKVERKEYERFVPGTRYRQEKSLALGLDLAQIDGEVRRVVVRIEPGESPEFEAALNKSRAAKQRADERVVGFFREASISSTLPAIGR